MNGEPFAFTGVSFFNAIWNEHDHRVVDHVRTIKAIDPDRIVTNSPGYAGELGSLQENRALDYLSPHTTRASDRPWEVAHLEIAMLLARFGKPVVDDEPARTGTAQFGGPRGETLPFDRILNTYNVWRAGGYIVYHHDMFQTWLRQSGGAAQRHSRSRIQRIPPARVRVHQPAKSIRAGVEPND